MNQLQLLRKSFCVLKKHGDYKGNNETTMMIVHSARLLRFFLIVQPIMMLSVAAMFLFLAFGKVNLWQEMLNWNEKATFPLLNIPGMILLAHGLMFLLIIQQFLAWPKSDYARFLEVAKLS